MARAFYAIVLILLILLYSLNVQAQSTKEMLAEIEGKWELDDNGNVTLLRIIEVPELKKDEIFTRVINYFKYNYGSGKSVIQTQDKEKGLIVGKGVYDNIHVGISLATTYVDIWHILRVYIKEGRVRVILSLTEYEKEVADGDSPNQFTTVMIASQQPINPRGFQKKT